MFLIMSTLRFLSLGFKNKRIIQNCPCKMYVKWKPNDWGNQEKTQIFLDVSKKITKDFVVFHHQCNIGLSDQPISRELIIFWVVDTLKFKLKYLHVTNLFFIQLLL